MREHIYRAYEKNHKVMDYTDRDLRVDFSDGGVYVCNNQFDFEDYELMLASNKFDKNGKLIFAGDIVKFFEKPLRKQTPIEMHSEVIFDGCMFKLSPNPIRWNEMYFSLLSEKLEIIGNKFKNPELLEN